MSTVRILKWTMRNDQWVEVPVVLTRTPEGWVEVLPDQQDSGYNAGNGGDNVPSDRRGRCDGWDRDEVRGRETGNALVGILDLPPQPGSGTQGRVQDAPRGCGLVAGAGTRLTPNPITDKLVAQAGY